MCEKLITIPLCSDAGYMRLLELAQDQPDLFLLAESKDLQDILYSNPELWQKQSITLASRPAVDAMNSITVGGPSTDSVMARQLRQALDGVPIHRCYDRNVWASLNCFAWPSYTAQRWDNVPTDLKKQSEFVCRHWLHLASNRAESNAGARLWWLYEFAVRMEHYLPYSHGFILDELCKNRQFYHQLLRRTNLIANVKFMAVLFDLMLEEFPEFNKTKVLSSLLKKLNRDAGSFLFDTMELDEMRNWVREAYVPKGSRGPNPRGHIPPALRILSLGGGIQSSVLCLMAGQGLILDLDTGGPCIPDYAFFADTGWELQHVYETVDWLKSRYCSGTPVLSA